MPRPLTSSASLDNLKKEARRWLNAVRAGDGPSLERLRRAHPGARAEPGLRDIQHALATEYGFTSWADLKAGVARLRAGGDPSSRDLALQTLLATADEGDAARAREVLDAHPDLVNERGTLPGHTGLRTALHFGVSHEPVVRLLLDRGADPNIRDEGDNAFPLHFAAENGDLSIIELLVEHGAHTVAGEVDDHRLDIIGWASCFAKTNEDVVRYLVAHGARHTILSAVATGETDAIRDLAARSPADLNRVMDHPNQGRRPLHLAVVKRQRASLETLLDLGADVSAADAAGLTALDQAALDGETDLAQILIGRGAKIELPAAIGLNRVDDVGRLLREDPDCLKPGHRWGRLIVRAAEHASGEAIQQLIRHGAEVNVQDDIETSIDHTTGYTALHAAAWNGNTAAAGMLLEHGADPTIRDGKYCGTPAGWADYNNKPECRDLILTRGAIDIFDAIALDRPDRIPSILERDPGALTRPFREYATCDPGDELMSARDMTPLHAATVANKPAAVRILTSRGAELVTGGHASRTPAERVAAFVRMACLDWAVGGPERTSHTHAAARLLARHPEIARSDIRTAVVCGEIDEVRRIVTERPEAASRSGGPRGWPPLLYLCNARLPERGPWSDNAIDVARLLLDSGADPNAYYPGGNESIHYTALTCVVGRGEEQAPVHPRARELAELLLSRGAEPYDQQVLYNGFAGHASHPGLADDDLTWMLELMYQHSIRRGRERDWQEPTWQMLQMGGYGGGAWYLLANALKGNYLGLARWVLSRGATPNPPSASDPRTPSGTLYEQAVRNGRIEFAELLARYGGRADVVSRSPHDEFVAAAFNLDRVRAQAILADHPEYLHEPAPLHSAAEQDRADVVALLLDLGLPPNLEQPRSRTRALHLAAYGGALATVRLLIDRGADIDPRDEVHGTTPIYWAFFGQRSRTVDLLTPNSRDVWTLTCAGKVDRLREILAAEPHLAAGRDETDTLLFYLPDDERAAAEIARLLVANGADPSVKRQDGTTAAQVARARGLDEAAEVLREQRATLPSQ